MLTLYYKPTCPFCQRVLGEAEALGVTFDLKDISMDEALVAELIEKGGKKQVPYLIDVEKDIAMYESGDIIKHLGDYYANNAGSADGVCESCQ